MQIEFTGVYQQIFSIFDKRRSMNSACFIQIWNKIRNIENTIHSQIFMDEKKWQERQMNLELSIV